MGLLRGLKGAAAVTEFIQMPVRAGLRYDRKPLIWNDICFLLKTVDNGNAFAIGRGHPR